MNPPSGSRANPLSAYAVAVFVPILGSAMVSPVWHLIDLSNAALLYVVAVVGAAARYGRGPAVLASFSSSLCFAYIFVPPHFSLAITEIQYLLTAGLMFLVALIVSHLTSKLKHHADAIEAKSLEIARLYALAQTLAGALSKEQVVGAAGAFLERCLAAGNVHVLSGESILGDGIPANAALVAQCLAQGKIICSPLSSGETMNYVPLLAASGSQGVLVFSLASASGTLLPKEFIEAAASVLAVALERSHFAERTKASEVMHASESLRNSILSSLSHDLRTPLTALVGLTETIAYGKISPQSQRVLCESVRQQAQSISQQFTKLLEMARLSFGPQQLDSAWQPVEEVIGATVQQVRMQWRDREISIDIAPRLPPISIDAVLIERVLWNLIENAIKYSPSETTVEVAARRVGQDIEISVCDAGEGLPEGRIDRLFDRFERGRVESSIPGMGLGLSIAKTVVEAHGGAISAENRFGGGSCFRIRLPVGDTPVIDELQDTA